MFPLLFEQIYELETPITSQLKNLNESIIIAGKWSVPVREANAFGNRLIDTNALLSALNLPIEKPWLITSSEFISGIRTTVSYDDLRRAVQEREFYRLCFLAATTTQGTRRFTELMKRAATAHGFSTLNLHSNHELFDLNYRLAFGVVARHGINSCDNLEFK